MKKIVYFSLLISTLCITSVHAQYEEFKTYNNGLIYDSTTMYHLSVIIDSLNLKFSTCELNEPFYPLPQGFAHYVKLSRSAKKEIENGISFENFSNKFPLAVKDKDVYIVQYSYIDWEGNKKLEYSGLPGHDDSPSLVVNNTTKNNKASGWVIGEENAFYLVDFKSEPIPEEYSRMIQYVDCMVDTTAQIYLHKADVDDSFGFVEDDTEAHKFIEWAYEFPNKPIAPEYDWENTNKDYDSLYALYRKAYDNWDSLRLVDLDSRYQYNPDRQEQLQFALIEAKDKGITDDMLEFYIARYISKEAALTLKRSRRVMGMCSQDDSPRVHATQICMLAAETHQWDIFLRSHLDIMNDRFDRMSDGNYAWGARKTYLKELEELGINTPDLLIGSCLFAQNVSDNHYNGSVRRIGRALAESSTPEEVEETIFKIIEDEQIDLHNRTVFVYLLANYHHHLQDEVQQKEIAQRYKVIKDRLPKELQQLDVF